MHRFLADRAEIRKCHKDIIRGSRQHIVGRRGDADVAAGQGRSSVLLGEHDGEDAQGLLFGPELTVVVVDLLEEHLALDLE